MAVAKPVGVVDDRCRPGFDAAVIAVDRLVPADRRVLEAVGLLLFDKYLDILAQGALVVLERENIVSLLVEDLARDGALAPHRVNGHDGAVDRQHVQQFRDRHDLVSATLTWPSTIRWRAAKTIWMAAFFPFS